MGSNYFIIHGSFGNPFVNWIPYLRNDITEQGKEVYTPDFPTGVGYQNYENWSRLLDCYVSAGVYNENTIVFAHSIAPVFLCKFHVERKIRVRRLVFVCGFNNYLGISEDFDAVNRSMFVDDLSLVRKYCGDIVCYYTDNDPYVRYDAEKDFADNLTVNQVFIHGGQHLNKAAGYIEFSNLLYHI